VSAAIQQQLTTADFSKPHDWLHSAFGV